MKETDQETKTKGMTLGYQVGAATDRGRLRESNEDAFGYSLEAGVFVVCDGMGGAAGGEVASRASVDAFLDAFKTRGWGRERPPEADSPNYGAYAAALLREAVEAANDAVSSMAEDDPLLEGMGTTLVALLVEPGRAWIAHVGDSRGYRMRGGVLERLTRDHSLVDEQVQRGNMTVQEAERSPLRNVITRAIGSHGPVTPEIAETDVQPGDLLLLSSDGLVREVTDSEIGRILHGAEGLEDACSQLIEAANAHGGKDNITCLLVRAPEMPAAE